MLMLKLLLLIMMLRIGRNDIGERDGRVAPLGELLGLGGEGDLLEADAVEAPQVRELHLDALLAVAVAHHVQLLHAQQPRRVLLLREGVHVQGARRAVVQQEAKRLSVPSQR